VTAAYSIAVLLDMPVEVVFWKFYVLLALAAILLMCEKFVIQYDSKVGMLINYECPNCNW